MNVDELLADQPDQPAADDTVPTAAGPVKVRGLSRLEVLDLGGRGKVDFERRLLALGVVDPALSEDQVAAWQAIPGRAGEIGRVSNRITELSGIGEGAAKAAYKSDGGEPGAGE